MEWSGEGVCRGGPGELDRGPGCSGREAGGSGGVGSPCEAGVEAWPDLTWVLAGPP